MRTNTRFFLGALLVVGIVGWLRADDTQPNGDAGEPARWEIRGATTFTAGEIEKALAADIDVAYASHPGQSLDIEPLLAKLSNKVSAGYQSQGFPHVKAGATMDHESGKVTITIDEGQRFTAGEVRVTGTKTIDALWLSQVLTPATISKLDSVGQADGPWPNRKMEAACWPVGKPARFDKGSVDELRRRIESLLLADQGRMLAKFTLDAKPDANEGVAPLVIHFSDEGVPAKVGKIEITGNKRNSHEQMLVFLELRPGMVLTDDVTVRINDRLRNSGRFLQSNVKTILPKKGGEPLKFRIDVTECDLLPPLDKALSREEKTLVRFSSWARQFENGDEELILEISSALGAQELIVSPRHGILATVRGVPSTVKPAEAAVPFQFAYVATDDEIGLFSFIRGRKVISVPPPSPLFANLEFEVHDRHLPLEGQGTFMAGLGMSSKAKQRSEGHFRVRINQVAAAALAIAHLENAQCTWEGDVLRVEYRDRCLRIDEKTGRIVELLLPTRNEPGEAHWRFSVAQGEFQRRLEVIKAATDDFPNDADDTRPLSCACKFLCDEALAWSFLTADPQVRRGIEIARKVCDLRLFEPLDELLAAACRPSPARNEFSIPQANLRDEETTSDLSQLIRMFAMCWGIPIGDHLLPHNTWVWNLWREKTFQYAQLRMPEGIEAPGFIPPPGTGAVGRLVTCLIVSTEANATSLSVAKDGLQRLSLDDFRRDYTVLLDQKSLLGRYVCRLADVIRTLDEDDLQWLEQTSAECLGPETAETLFELTRLLRASPQPVETALPKMLDTWWKLGMRQVVETALKQRAEPPAGAYAGLAPHDATAPATGLPRATVAPPGTKPDDYPAPAKSSSTTNPAAKPPSDSKTKPGSAASPTTGRRTTPGRRRR